MTFVPPKMLPRSSDDQLAVAAKMVVILADPRYVLFRRPVFWNTRSRVLLHLGMPQCPQSDLCRHREIWNRVRWMSSKPDSEFSPELVDLGCLAAHVGSFTRVSH